MKIRSLFFLLLIVISCAKNKARRPINPKSSTTLFSETVQVSKALNQREVNLIEDVIVKDTLHTYLSSKSGFWYYYNHQINENLPTPKVGDKITFEYNIADLEGNVIYSKQDLGVKTYFVDKEILISALQKGIKLMKVGETITFVIPSYHAYGISGDDQKVKPNTIIKSTVTLLNIN